MLTGKPDNNEIESSVTRCFSDLQRPAIRMLGTPARLRRTRRPRVPNIRLKPYYARSIPPFLRALPSAHV